VVLAPEWGSGWLLEVHAVSCLFHLFTLIQLALITQPPMPLLPGGFLPQPEWVGKLATQALEGVPTSPNTDLYDNAQLEFWHWSAVHTVLSDTGRLGAPVGVEMLQRHALKADGMARMKDMQVLDGHHVIILTPLCFPKSWDLMHCRAAHPSMAPEAKVLESLSQEDVESWLLRAKLAAARTAAEELVEVSGQYEERKRERMAMQKASELAEVEFTRSVFNRRRNEGSRCTSRAVSRATFDLVFPTQDEDEEEFEQNSGHVQHRRAHLLRQPL